MAFMPTRYNYEGHLLIIIMVSILTNLFSQHTHPSQEIPMLPVLFRSYLQDLYRLLSQ